VTSNKTNMKKTSNKIVKKIPSWKKKNRDMICHIYHPCNENLFKKVHNVTFSSLVVKKQNCIHFAEEHCFVALWLLATAHEWPFTIDNALYNYIWQFICSIKYFYLLRHKIGQANVDSHFITSCVTLSFYQQTLLYPAFVLTGNSPAVQDWFYAFHVNVSSRSLRQLTFATPTPHRRQK